MASVIYFIVAKSYLPDAEFPSIPLCCDQAPLVALAYPDEFATTNRDNLHQDPILHLGRPVEYSNRNNKWPIFLGQFQLEAFFLLIEDLEQLLQRPFLHNFG